MNNLWQRLLEDETGVIVSSELALVGTVGVLGMVVGLESVSTAVTQELTDLSSAFRSLNQSYSYRSISKAGHGRISGSCFTDVGGGGGVLATADVNGQLGGSASSQTVFGNAAQTVSTNTIQVLRGQAIEEVIEEVPVTIKSVETECPDDEIIEEHVIRRRVKANKAATLSEDCAKSSQTNALKKGSSPENSVNSIPKSKSTPDKIETKPKKNH